MNYAAVINEWAEKHGIPASLGRALVYHESGANPLALGDGGFALSLTQIHRVAADDLGRANDWNTLLQLVRGGSGDEAAILSCDMGFEYLSKQIDRFGDFDIALMAYNQGPTVIWRAWDYKNAIRKLEGTV